MQIIVSVKCGIKLPFQTQFTKTNITNPGDVENVSNWFCVTG